MSNFNKVARIGVASLVLIGVVVCSKLGDPVAFGTLCALCPVGFTQIAVASQDIPWSLLPGVLVVLAAVFVLGRVFCSWACPSQLLKNVFGGRTPRGILGRSHTPKEKSCSTCGGDSKNLKTQGFIFLVLLIVSFVVKFPVFCLFCPIGLVFGTIWAIDRMFVLLQPGWELFVFPAMLIAELFLFKRWCSAICPLGFFFGLIGKLRSKLGFGVVPKADCSTCLSQEGCHACSTVCAEDIDVSGCEQNALEECSLCLDCVQECPSKSISVKLQMPGKSEEQQD